MSRSLLLDATLRLMSNSVFVLAVYLLFAGHNQPGGGFVGGLVAAAAVALRYVAGGIGAVRSTFPVPPWMVLALGLGLASTTAFVPLLTGSPPLDNGKIEWSLPVLGTVKATSAVIFDTGVFVVVVGLVLMVFEALGDDELADGEPVGAAFTASNEEASP